MYFFTTAIRQLKMLYPRHESLKHAYIHLFSNRSALYISLAEANRHEAHRIVNRHASGDRHLFDRFVTCVHYFVSG